MQNTAFVVRCLRLSVQRRHIISLQNGYALQSKRKQIELKKEMYLISSIPFSYSIFYNFML